MRMYRHVVTFNLCTLHNGRIPKQVESESDMFLFIQMSNSSFELSRANSRSTNSKSGDQRVDAEGAAYVKNPRYVLNIYIQQCRTITHISWFQSNIICHRTTCLPSFERAFIRKLPSNTQRSLNNSETEEHSHRKAAIIGLSLLYVSCLSSILQYTQPVLS